VRILVDADLEDVTLTAELCNVDGTIERVRAHGDTLTEAIENLVMRFKVLQDGAIEEMRRRGFIRTVSATEGVVS
jgi:hypothetical protein